MTATVGSYDYDGIQFTLLQLALDDALDAAAGDRVFVMLGRVTVAGFVITAPRIVIFGTPRRVEAIDDLVYLFRWTHPDAPDERHDAA